MPDLFLHHSAVFSPCGRYRYHLSRIWDHNRPPLAWIMLNPSTADEKIDDPTIRRCMGFARREGAGGVEILNLFAWRSTIPKALRSVDDPIGQDNDKWIEETLRSHLRVVCAWGEFGKYLGRDTTVLNNLRNSATKIMYLGDKPKHPLYIRHDQPLVEIS
jgi:hypothetical protein